MAQGRSEVLARHGMVATSDPLPAEAGLEILRQGGNAIDAAVATGAVLDVTSQNDTGIGGDLLALAVGDHHHVLHGGEQRADLVHLREQLRRGHDHRALGALHALADRLRAERREQRRIDAPVLQGPKRRDVQSRDPAGQGRDDLAGADLDRAAETKHQRAHRGKSDPLAGAVLRAGAAEKIEDALMVRWRDAAAVVGDLDRHPRAGLPSAHDDAAGHAGLQIFDRIVDEVGDDLVDREAIGDDRRHGCEHERRIQWRRVVVEHDHVGRVVLGQRDRDA